MTLNCNLILYTFTIKKQQGVARPLPKLAGNLLASKLYRDTNRNYNLQHNIKVHDMNDFNTGQEPEVVETAKPTGPVTIVATNPSPEEMVALCENIRVNHDFKVDVKPVKFNFKKQKDKDTGIETIREAVELAIAFPSVEGIIAILEAGGKQLELLQDAVEGVITGVARDIIAEDTGINASNFPIDKISWDSIANMPKAQRRGGGIPKEVWEGFAQDYTEVMPEATGKSVEQITNAAKILAAKLTAVRTNEPVLELLVEQLAIYADNSPNIEEYKECVEFLLNKAETFLNVSPEELLANL